MENVKKVVLIHKGSTDKMPINSFGKTVMSIVNHRMLSHVSYPSVCSHA